MEQTKSSPNRGKHSQPKTQREKVQGIQTRGRAQRKSSQKESTKTKGENQGAAEKAKGKTKTQAAAKEEKTQEEKDLELQIRNLEWMAQRAANGLRPIWTLDLETDPFARDKVPVPFVAGLFDGVTFRSFWSDRSSSCIDKVKMFLEDVPKEDRGIIYTHNGGRFDFFYLLDWFQGKTVIMNSRIVKAIFEVGNISENTRRKRANEYQFEFRDSYAIMPFALKAYKKDDIDINFLKRENRGKHKEEITSYLKGDCVYLWELCMEFQREFGDYLTIASAAFAQLQAMHNFDKLPENQDREIRKKFYYGGRVQCFQKGVIEQPCKIYDVNSMYPSVMKDYWHPTSHCCLVDSTIRWSDSWAWNKLRTFFVTCEGKNYGAFPVRLPDGSIDFTREDGIFHVSIHEYNTALECGLFKPTKILQTHNFSTASKFSDFVLHFFNARNLAKKSGDSMRVLFYKFILNSAYGKFALNPENYYSWYVSKTTKAPGDEWQLDSMVQGKYYVWKKPGKTYSWNLKNIATAASITGAARSILLSAISKSLNVLYCDTDSIICEKFAGGTLSNTQLGGWKPEGEGNLAAIAGKKMYAIFSGDKCIKQANKGVDLTPVEILKICKGEDVITFRDAPSFKRDGSAKFISRTVRMT